MVLYRPVLGLGRWPKSWWGPEGRVHWEVGGTGQSLSKLAGKGSQGGGDTKARGVEALDLSNPNNKDEPKKGGF